MITISAARSIDWVAIDYNRKCWKSSIWKLYKTETNILKYSNNRNTQKTFFLNFIGMPQHTSSTKQNLETWNKCSQNKL